MSLSQDNLMTFFEQKLGVDTSGVDESTAIFSSGMVDSFSLVSLITYIEQEGGFRVSPMDVNLENLDSVEKILAFAERKNSDG